MTVQVIRASCSAMLAMCSRRSMVLGGGTVVRVRVARSVHVKMVRTVDAPGGQKVQKKSRNY